MKAIDIQNFHNSLSKLKDKRLPVRVAFILSRNLSKMENIIQDLEQQRMDLIRKYGEMDEEGNPKINEEGNVKILNPKQFSEEINDLYSSDIELVLDCITMSDIEKCDTDDFDSLTVDEVSSLNCMLADDELSFDE